MDNLQKELLKLQDNLQDVEIKLPNQTIKFYFRYLTLLEKVRIETMCVKPTYTLHADGSRTVKEEKQDHLIPIHTILEKALDKDGKRLFDHMKDFDLIAKLPAGIASYVAYQMSLDIMGNLTNNESE